MACYSLVYLNENLSFFSKLKVFVAPASITKHMNTLENRLGITLLKRNNQGISLTRAGEALYKDSKKLTTEAENAVFKAKNIERGEGTVIRIGSSLLNPSKVLTDLWLPLGKKYKQYRFSIVPYKDTKEQILSVVSSLGEHMDVLVSVFNSNKMLDNANISNRCICITYLCLELFGLSGNVIFNLPALSEVL